jgi:hypothetical protein
MKLFWNNGKKVRSDAKNLFSDKRYKNNGNKLSGGDQASNIIADLFNTFPKK